MTTGNARIEYDLRTCFLPAAFDADGNDEDDQTHDGEGTETGDGSADPAGGDGGEAKPEIKDPERKRLSDEAAAHRVRAKKAEEALTAATGTIQELRMHNAFLRAALPLVDDLDAAWKLSDHSLAKIDDEGNVTGMDTMIAAALRSYPYLERVVDTVPTPLPGSGGTPANGRRSDPNSANAALLEKKYPALRRR